MRCDGGHTVRHLPAMGVGRHDPVLRADVFAGGQRLQPEVPHSQQACLKGHMGRQRAPVRRSPQASRAVALLDQCRARTLLQNAEPVPRRSYRCMG